MKMTTSSPVSLSRRHVLGDLYRRCDAMKGRVPVYLEGDEHELLGHANEDLGRFADAISFFLSDDNCKKLSSGQFAFAVDYNLSQRSANGAPERVVLTAITLVGREDFARTIARRR